ncbi:MAG: nickel pincer cofactor biosynthesis protein LarC [Thermoguttaceae bacterium]
MQKLAYLDCSCGISGDMLLGALLDAGVSLEMLNQKIASLGLPGCRVQSEEVRRQGFRGVKANVLYAVEREHRHLSRILTMIDAAQLSAVEKERAGKIFTRLAQAEAKVHGVEIEKIHFHEVGAADAIADIVSAVAGLSFLGVERIVSSPVAVGGGTISMSHGQCGVPAPATAELLCGAPLVESNIKGELTTPTGAAILSVLADDFGAMPTMIVEQIGYGAGNNDWHGLPNILRLFLGNSPIAAEQGHCEQICQMETNLDDLSAELIGYCIERLWSFGALDVYTTAVGMKKNRPGTLLTVLCPPEEADRLEKIIFQETSTLGIRRFMVERTVLARQTHVVKTIWGPIEGKIAWYSGQTPSFTPEFESCRRIATAENLPLSDVYNAAQKAFEPEKVIRETAE